MTTQLEQRKPRSYGNWSRPKSAGLLGLGMFGTIVLLASMIVAVILTIAVNLLWGFGFMAAVSFCRRFETSTGRASSPASREGLAG